MWREARGDGQDGCDLVVYRCIDIILDDPGVGSVPDRGTSTRVGGVRMGL